MKYVVDSPQHVRLSAVCFQAGFCSSECLKAGGGPFLHLLGRDADRQAAVKEQERGQESAGLLGRTGSLPLSILVFPF